MGGLCQTAFWRTERVLKYLARYTQRVAISNHRLRSLEDGRVSFDWKDYAHQGRTAITTLDAVEFIRRFLLHVLPSGLVRIRQFGFLANRIRASKLKHCLALFAVRLPIQTGSEDDSPAQTEDSHRSPICNLGRRILVELLSPQSIPVVDTS
jgi:hypothetical protein